MRKLVGEAIAGKTKTAMDATAGEVVATMVITVGEAAAMVVMDTTAVDVERYRDPLIYLFARIPVNQHCLQH